MIKYSIILSTYNWPEALNLVLTSLSKQLTDNLDTELIIADDGSNNATTQLINQYKGKLPNLKHIWHEDTGFTKAIILNKAVVASQGAYLIFLDGDCVVFPDFILQHKLLKQDGYFVAGNRVLLSPEFTQELIANKYSINQIYKWKLFDWVIAKFTKKINKILIALRMGNGSWRLLRKNDWKFPKGCNFAVSRADFMAVNGFDEEFIGWGHEDSDLFIRLMHNQIKVKDGRFALGVIHLWHKQSQTDSTNPNKMRLMQRVADPLFIEAASGISKH